MKLLRELIELGENEFDDFDDDDDSDHYLDNEHRYESSREDVLKKVETLLGTDDLRELTNDDEDDFPIIDAICDLRKKNKFSIADLHSDPEINAKLHAKINRSRPVIYTAGEKFVKDLGQYEWAGQCYTLKIGDKSTMFAEIQYRAKDHMTLNYDAEFIVKMDDMDMFESLRDLDLGDEV